MSAQLEQLKAFVTVVEENSISAAARKLGKAQSSVSALIQNLEIELDLVLFDRSSRNAKLSSEGAAILPEARNVLHSLESMETKSRNLNTGVESHLTLAIDEAMFPAANMASLIGRFRLEFPDTQLVLLFSPHTGPAELIQEGRADLGIIRSIDDYPEDFHFRGIGSIEFVTVCGESHPLAGLSTVTEEDLVEQCHIRITSPQQGQRSNDSDISRHRIYVDNYNHLLGLVAEDLGWAQLPLHMLESYSERNRLVRIESHYQPMPYVCSSDLIWKRSDQPGSAARWLVEQLRIPRPTPG